MKSINPAAITLGVIISALMGFSAVQALGSHHYLKLSPFGSSPDKAAIQETRIRKQIEEANGTLG